MGQNDKAELISGSEINPKTGLLQNGAPDVVYLAVCFCFLLSGFAALLYQVAWLRLFSTFFGTSEYAVTIVLASYMSGLAIGAWVAGKYLNRIRHPILVYGFLELLIAVTALCVPLMLKFAGVIFGLIVGGQTELPSAGGFMQPAFYVGASMMIMGIPTACMGATLPILMRHVIDKDQHIGRRTGILYGVNTAGAVLGTIAAGFLFLPALGMNATVWLGVAVNILIYLVAIIIVLAQGVDPAERILKRSRPQAESLNTMSPKRHWILPLMLASGMISFFYEVLWTRILGHVVGGSVAAFAIMLAAFLTGIALGGFVGGLIATSKKRALWMFGLMQILIAGSSAFIYLKIDGLIPDVSNTRTHAILAYSVMLPATFFIGTTFPLAVRILTQNPKHSGKEAARIYAWNTIGAVMGALIAGFILIPGLGFEGTIVLCVIGNIMIALVLILTQYSGRQKLITASAVMSLIVASGFWRPERPDSVVNYSPLSSTTRNFTNEEFYGVGRSATVLGLSSFHEVFYRSNGLPEANVVRKGAPPAISSQQWLGAIPPLIRPEARNMLVVGYGGGAVLEAIPQHIEEIDVVELEPEVIEANRATADLRKFNPLEDSRVKIVLNDARNALHLSDKSFDIIVSQPSHPWTAGASHLFTKEYMSLAKQHLNRDGVFLQWINAEFVTEQLLRDLAATLLSEFQYVRLAQVSPNALHFYASDTPLEIENSFREVGSVIGAEPRLFASIGINSFYDVLATIVLDSEGTRNFAKTGNIIKDNHNQLATFSRQFGGGLTNQSLMSLLQPYDPFIYRNSMKLRDLGQDQALYVLGAMVRLGMSKRAWDIMDTLDTEAYRSLARAAIYKAGDNRSGARDYGLRAFEDNPNNEDARYFNVYQDMDHSAFKSREFAELGADSKLKSILELSKAAALRDWQTILDREEELIQIPLTKTYSGQALYLRAQALANLSVDTRSLQKALALTERSNLLEPAIAKLQLRLEVAKRLNDHDRVINSIWLINQSLRNARLNRDLPDKYAGKSGEALLIQDLSTYEMILNQIISPGLQERVGIVRAQLSKLVSDFDGGKAKGATSSP